MKKINAELEKLDDEELEEIAGGRKTPGRWFNNVDTDQPKINTVDVITNLKH